MHRKKQTENNVMATVVLIVLQVVEGGVSFGALLQSIPWQEKPYSQHPAKIKAQCFQLIRFLPRMEVLLAQLLKKPLPRKERVVALLIALGLLQLSQQKTAPHALVNECVNAASLLKKSWASGLVNACLRGFLRRREQYLISLEENPIAQYAHPQWWIEAIKKSRPDDWQSILQANNQQAPLSLRVNQRRINRCAYRELLAKDNLKAVDIAYTSAGLQLETAVSVQQLPGFHEGLCSVQDGAGQLLEGVLQKSVLPKFEWPEDARILDACAAPGSKTCHLLEVLPQHIQWLVLDQNAERMQLLSDNLRRLQLSSKRIETKIADATQLNDWWDGQAFDLILCDAPCSGSGVIRRHPDIKLLRRASDISSLVDTQQQLLKSLWPALKVGGRMLYSTCSILKEEGADQINRFSQQQSDAEQVALDGIWGQVDRSAGGEAAGGCYVLPGEMGMDGFFYGCLKKGKSR